MYITRKKINYWIVTIRTLPIYVHLIVSTLLPLFLNIISSILFPSEQNIVDTLSFNDLVILIVLINPFFETLIFQDIIYKIFKNLNINIVTLISSALFGLIHLGNIYDFIIAFLVGIIYMQLYITIKIYKNRSPLLYVFLVHSLHNLIALIIYYIS